MRIALVSFEFPPSVAIGGIGAYAWEAAVSLAEAGCDVEVFAAGLPGCEPASAFGVKVHRIQAETRTEFSSALLGDFSRRHRQCPFDLLESPEIGAEGLAAAQSFPEIARVVKLHTPSYVVGDLAWEEPRISEKVRFTLGALRRGRWGRLVRPRYLAKEDTERDWTLMADEVAAPCDAIASKVGNDWSLDRRRVSVIPLPYRPPRELLGLPFPSLATTVGFLGRLEPRKGILELVQAIPRILREVPETRFRLLGPSWAYRGIGMENWIRRAYPKIVHAIDFRGAIEREDLAAELSVCDIIVLPSRWENFPYACWESLASGRAVIGSAVGGMADVIEDRNSGLLVQPRSPEDIGDKILSLLGKGGEVRRLAAAGRARVTSFLNPSRVIPLQLASYQRAVDRSRERRLQA